MERLPGVSVPYAQALGTLGYRWNADKYVDLVGNVLSEITIPISVRPLWSWMATRAIRSPRMRRC